MIGYTLAEIRGLLVNISQHQPPSPDHAWPWSRWRRKRQYQARICHYWPRLRTQISAVAVLSVSIHGRFGLMSVLAVA
jgi:hypothetical protein